MPAFFALNSKPISSNIFYSNRFWYTSPRDLITQMLQNKKLMESTLDQAITIIDPSTISPRNTGLKWGAVGALMSTIIGLVSYLAGLTSPSATATASGGGIASSLITLVLLVVAFVVVGKAIDEHRTDLGGFIRGGRCVSIGLWSGLSYGVLSAVWALIFYGLIVPDFFEEMQSAMVTLWESQGLSDEEIDMALGYSAMFQGTTSMAVFSFISGIFSGLFISLILALFMKKKAPGQF